MNKMDIKNRDFWREKLPDYIMEYGIYLFVIFLFIGKGESFRSIGLYAPPVILAVRVYLTKQSPFDWKNPIFLCVVALCLSGIAASFFAPSLTESFNWFKRTYLKLLLLFIVISFVFRKPALLIRLSFLFTVLLFLFSLMTFYDYMTEAILAEGAINWQPAVRKYISPLETFIPFVPLFILISKSKSIKALWVIVLIMGIVAALITGARGGWISIGVSLFLWGILYSRLTKKRIAAVIPYIIGAAITIFLLLTIVRVPHIMEKVRQGFDTSNRASVIWKAAVGNYNKLSALHKLIGNGLDQKTYLKDFSEWHNRRYGYYPSKENIYTPHNFYLYTLYKQGIIGLLILLALIFTCIKEILFRITSRNDIAKPLLGISILSAFVGSFIIHGFVEDQRFLHVFGLLLCIIGAYTNDNPLSNSRNTA